MYSAPSQAFGEIVKNPSSLGFLGAENDPLYLVLNSENVAPEVPEVPLEPELPEVPAGAGGDGCKSCVIKIVRYAKCSYT
jgi:hypothetical protein